jgi:hypothetical protein
MAQPQNRRKCGRFSLAITVGYVRSTMPGYNVIGYDVTNPGRPTLLPTPWPDNNVKFILSDGTYERQKEAVSMARHGAIEMTKWGWAALYVGELATYFNNASKRDAATAERFRTADG